jgi:two-component system sensor histidine kinase UhpB
LLVLIAIFFVIVNAMIYFAVGRALRPVSRILDALVEFEHGNLDARLPKINLPELTAISDKFNSMAQTMQNSIRNNHRLTQEMISLQEQERKSLARDLHDEIGQHLTAIHVDASAILNAKNIRDAHESAVAIDTVARQMMTIVHGMLQFLRPSGLDVLGLSVAVKELVDGWRHKNPKTSINLEFEGVVDGADEAVSIVIYRLVQECLTNIARHADADEVSILLARKSDFIELEIDDDGRGFDTNIISSGFGLAGMHERVQGAGGIFNLETKPGHGVKVRVILPFKFKLAS